METAGVKSSLISRRRESYLLRSILYYVSEDDVQEKHTPGWPIPAVGQIYDSSPVKRTVHEA